MRWYIAEAKRRIASVHFEGHSDHVEMSGEKVSAVITYAVKENHPVYARHFSFPMVRVQPNNTYGSYQPKADEPPIVFPEPEQFVRVEFDGVLSVFSRAGCLSVIRRFFPSTAGQAFYERLEITNQGHEPMPLDYDDAKRLEVRLACEGYVVFERRCDMPPQMLLPGKTVAITFAYIARFANERIEREADPLTKRRARVAELMSQVDVTTGDDVVDTMFAFAKLRAGESLFRTEKGLVHSPGGLSYYAAVWCNDECEYAAPWFAFTGDEKAAEATLNCFRWYYPYMTDDDLPIPSSLIAQGRDYWCGAGDRGDAAMYLYGFCRYLLTRGDLPDNQQQKALRWCAAYILRKINEDNVVVSDTDEMENRISSGINLNTSALAFGALSLYALVLKRLGQDAREILAAKERIRGGIESFFGATVSGYATYQYHPGCQVIRAWNCLPVYMGILERAEETMASIADCLWCNGSCRSTEGDLIQWDRSALYFMAALFRMGDVEQAFDKLREFSAERLLGDHVPYAVEAYPEGDKRHLSGESALYCRVITDGLLNMTITENGAVARPRLPQAVRSVRVQRIFINGQLQDFSFSNPDFNQSQTTVSHCI